MLAVDPFAILGFFADKLLLAGLNVSNAFVYAFALGGVIALGLLILHLCSVFMLLISTLKIIDVSDNPEFLIFPGLIIFLSTRCLYENSFLVFGLDTIIWVALIGSMLHASRT